MAAFKAGTATGYRLMHWPAIDDDFKPLAALPRCSAARKKRCSSLALSLFVSPETARAMIARNLTDRGVDPTGWLGDQLGVVEIVEDDGLISEPNDDGHFALHEFEGISLLERVAHLGPLYESVATAGGSFAS
jgi:hypothetical protein